MKRKTYFFIYVLSGLVMLLATIFVSFYSKQKVKSLNSQVSILNQELHKEILKKKRLYLYSDINLLDSNIIDHYFDDYEDNSTYYCFYGQEKKAKEKKLPFNADEFMKEYVLERYDNNDSLKLCPFCYLRHKERFDFLIDSIFSIK
jgi:hypothetical protein